MATPKHLTLARLAPALALLSCAAPKAHAVEQPKPQPEAVAAVPAAPEAGALPLPDRGIRLPDMLALPSDAEFRATTPPAPKGGSEAGAVISRPPTDQPSRPKPKDPAKE